MYIALPAHCLGRMGGLAPGSVPDAYQKENGVEVRVARIFNTFGDRMHMGDGRVVSNFIVQALQNKPITIYGEGQQTRSFQCETVHVC